MVNFESVYSKALALASAAHDGQFDHAGKAYIHHPVTVSGYCRTPKAKICALLHDVLEDTDVTRETLLAQFGEDITGTVELLTKHKGDVYMDYVRRLSVDPAAREVKLADLRHNMDLTRNTRISETDVNRLVRQYVPAYNYLMEKEQKENA